MLITWDEPKRKANLAKHGLDFADFADAFDFSHFAALAARPGRDGRARFLFVGAWSDDIVVAAVVSRLGSEALSLISVRVASRKERDAYERI